MERRGISPIVAVILLIVFVALVIIIILIVAFGVGEEGWQKKGKSAEDVCKRMILDAYLDEEILYMENIGDYPTYQILIKKMSGDYVEKETLDIRLGEGSSYSEELDLSGIDEVLVIPVALGTIGNQKVAKICADKFGTQVYV